MKLTLKQLLEKKRLIDYLPKIKTKEELLIEELTTLKADLISKVESAIEQVKSIKPIKGDPGYSPKLGVDFHIPTVEEIAKRVKVEHGKTPIAGLDFHVPTVDEILGKIPLPEKGKDGTEITDKEIIDKINAAPIKWEYQIDWDHIRGVPDFGKGKRTIHRGGMTLQLYTLSTQLDGVTKSFSIPANNGIWGVNSSSSPFGAFEPTVDYIGSGTTTITFTDQVDAAVSLAIGQKIVIAFY